ncbi:MAG: sulfatase-like hydrolase/transferase [Bacteroidales bacterium]|nr:sulfatase-like hydrolase/transferase [Bacteroidales bacterium]
MSRLFAQTLQFFIPYFKIVILLFISIFILKVADSVLLFFYENVHVLQVLLRGFYQFFLACSLFSLCVLPIYALMYPFHKKGAIILTSTIFGLLFFIELGLTIYALQTGKLLDNEIFIRPFSEIYITIHSTIHLAWVFLILAGIVFFFIFFAFRIEKKQISNVLLGVFFGLSIVGTLLILNKNTRALPDKHYNPSVQNYIANKTWYCIQSYADYKSQSLKMFSYTSYNNNFINAFLSEFPNWNIPDSLYPLEREDGIPNVLGPYFEESKTPPNIVVIVVESLGRDWSGDTPDGISFTPFLDSLSKTGLYWKNCITTTSRSFGAVPAITGSLPYGMKGFQFGNMPKHNSLISILNDNNYQTNAFYGGDFSFDCISEYLLAQKIDYMSPFYQEYKTNKTQETKGNWWGYFDDVMFDKSMEVLNSRKNNSNLFNLFITITAHEDLKLKDDNKQKHYISMVKAQIDKLPQEKQKKYRMHVLRIAATMYSDDCLRTFFHTYSQRADFSNTIFVITGDHASGLNIKNRLSYHHVPLLIWSPLLSTHNSFPALITHNDITPSLISLLKNNYHLQTPEFVHWISDGLDTSSSFRMQSKMLFLTYSREIREFLYDNYYYHDANQTENETIYIVDENLSMKACSNDSLLKILREKMNVYKYINNYTYHADRLTKNPVYKEEAYRLLHHLIIKNQISCITPEIQPDNKNFNTCNILKAYTFSTDSFQKVKVTLKAMVCVNTHLFADEHMDIVFSVKRTNMEYVSESKEKIAKFIASEKIEKETWYPLFISKEILVKNAKQLDLSMYISTVSYNHEWVPNSQLTLKNVSITIEGVR